MYEPWEPAAFLPMPSFDFSPPDVEDPSLPSNSAAPHDYFSVSITTEPLFPYYMPSFSSPQTQQSSSPPDSPLTSPLSAMDFPASDVEQQQQHTSIERSSTPLGSSFFDFGWERALSLSLGDDSGGDMDCLGAKTEGRPKKVTFDGNPTSRVILRPSSRPARPRLSPSAGGPSIDPTYGIPTSVVSLKSYPIPDLSSRSSDPTFSSTSLVAESSFQPSSTYPSSSYPPYPQAFTTSAQNPRTPYSHPYPSSDAFLPANSSYNGFRPYQQHQQLHHAQYSFSDKLSASPIHHPHSSQPSFNAQLDVISHGMSFLSSTSLLHLTQSIAEYFPTHPPSPPLSPEPDTFLPLDLVLPFSPVSMSSHASSGADGGRAASASSSFGKKRRVPESLEEMLEDEEIVRLSKRVTRGDYWESQRF